MMRALIGHFLLSVCFRLHRAFPYIPSAHRVRGLLSTHTHRVRRWIFSWKRNEEIYAEIFYCAQDGFLFSDIFVSVSDE
jgi:hypothetical protein